MVARRTRPPGTGILGISHGDEDCTGPQTPGEPQDYAWHDVVVMRQQPEVLAIVGLSGSGKSSAVEYLSSTYGYRPVYFGGVVVEEVERRGLPVTPANERIVREDMREREGMAVVAMRRVPQIKEYCAKGLTVVVDGIYGGAELDYLNSALESPAVTVAIHAPRWLRKKRLSKRPNRPLTADQVDQRDRFEIKHLDKATPIVTADLHIVNDATPTDLGDRLSKSLEDLRRAVAESGTDPEPNVSEIQIRTKQ